MAGQLEQALTKDLKDANAKIEMLSHPLFCYVMRAMDDVSGELESYLPPQSLDLSGHSDKVSDFLSKYLQVLDLQRSKLHFLHQKHSLSAQSFTWPKEATFFQSSSSSSSSSNASTAVSSLPPMSTRHNLRPRHKRGEASSSAPTDQRSRVVSRRPANKKQLGAEDSSESSDEDEKARGSDDDDYVDEDPTDEGEEEEAEEQSEEEKSGPPKEKKERQSQRQTRSKSTAFSSSKKEEPELVKRRGLKRKDAEQAAPVSSMASTRRSTRQRQTSVTGNVKSRSVSKSVRNLCQALEQRIRKQQPSSSESDQ